MLWYRNVSHTGDLSLTYMYLSRKGNREISILTLWDNLHREGTWEYSFRDSILCFALPYDTVVKYTKYSQVLSSREQDLARCHILLNHSHLIRRLLDHFSPVANLKICGCSLKRDSKPSWLALSKQPKLDIGTTHNVWLWTSKQGRGGYGNVQSCLFRIPLISLSFPSEQGVIM